MKQETYYEFPLTISEETFKVRQELTNCLTHILVQAALKGIDLTTFTLDDEPFDFDYTAMTALTDIFETDKDVIIYIESDSDLFDFFFPEQDLPEDYSDYTVWETDYLNHHFTFWLN